MFALTLMFIRHAEKEDGDFPGKGIDFEGAEDSKSLIVRGWQRAGAWAALLGTSSSPDYPRPNVVYAAKPEPIAKGAKFSHRPFETATPLAEKLGLPLVTKWGVGEEQQLVEELRGMSGPIVVFWEHKTIASGIIPALLNGQHVVGVPLKWDGDRFDVILRFDRVVPDAPWSFRQLSPRLLAGDTDAGMSKVET